MNMYVRMKKTCLQRHRAASCRGWAAGKREFCDIAHTRWRRDKKASFLGRSAYNANSPSNISPGNVQVDQTILRSKWYYYKNRREIAATLNLPQAFDPGRAA